MATAASIASPAAPGRFYVAMAVACTVIAILGFTPTYWAPLTTGGLSAAPIVHLHALIFTAWMLFFVAQTGLVASGRTAHHRELGLLGISIATAMLVVGLATAIHSAETHIAAGFGERARAFMIVPISTILYFAVGVAIAIANRSRPEIHKRWMLLSSIAILMAAVARIVRFAMFGSEVPPGPPPIEVSVIPALGTDLLIVAAMVRDWRTRGAPHPVYWLGGGLWLVVQLGRIPFSKSPQWHAVADWLLSF